MSSELPAALVLAFHGLGGPALSVNGKGRLSAKADETRSIVVYPVGAYDEPNPAWDVLSDADTQFVNALLDALEAGGCVDPARVFATGFSMGGGMANVVACRIGDRIAAIAPVSGTYGAAWGSVPCRPARPVPVLAFHGRADDAVLYPGGPLFGEVKERPTEAVEQWAREWAQRNGCPEKPSVSRVGSDVELRSWKACAAPVELYTVTDGGHTWPGGVNDPSDGIATNAISATDLMWTFFDANPLPR